MSFPKITITQKMATSFTTNSEERTENENTATLDLTTLGSHIKGVVENNHEMIQTNKKIPDIQGSLWSGINPAGITKEIKDQLSRACKIQTLEAPREEERGEILNEQWEVIGERQDWFQNKKGNTSLILTALQQWKLPLHRAEAAQPEISPTASGLRTDTLESPALASTSSRNTQINFEQAVEPSIDTEQGDIGAQAPVIQSPFLSASKYLDPTNIPIKRIGNWAITYSEVLTTSSQFSWHPIGSIRHKDTGIKEHETLLDNYLQLVRRFWGDFTNNIFWKIHMPSISKIAGLAEKHTQRAFALWLKEQPGFNQKSKFKLSDGHANWGILLAMFKGDSHALKGEIERMLNTE